MTDIDLDDRISEMLAECELALRGKSYGGWCEVRYPARDIARLIRRLKQTTEKAQALLDDVMFSARESFCPVGDELEFHEAWKIEAPNEFEAWSNLKAALAYNGDPDA